MYKTFSLEQLSKTSNIYSILIFRQKKLFFMARFMEIKHLTPKCTQDQIANVLGCSISTLQRYKHRIKILSPYKISPISHKGNPIQTLMIIQIVNMTSK